MGRLALIALASVCLAGAGCVSADTTATPEQTKSFEGGPMPPGTHERVQEELAKARAEAERKAAEQRTKTF